MLNFFVCHQSFCGEILSLHYLFRENLDKSEKEAVNLVARASGEGRAMVRPGSIATKGGDAANDTVDMTSHERDVCGRFVRLIQYHPSRDPGNQETPADPDKLLADSLANSSQHE